VRGRCIQKVQRWLLKVLLLLLLLLLLDGWLLLLLLQILRGLGRAS
jgi:hypothetical protein